MSIKKKIAAYGLILSVLDGEKNTHYLCNLVTEETCQKFVDLIKLSSSGMEFTGMFKT